MKAESACGVSAACCFRLQQRNNYICLSFKHPAVSVSFCLPAPSLQPPLLLLLLLLLR